MAYGLDQAVIAFLTKGSSSKAIHSSEGMVATMNSRWRAFGIFGALLFTAVLTGLVIYWPDLWQRATILKKIMYVAAFPWMGFLIPYFAIIPRNWRLVITAEGVKERMWTSRYTFTPWSEIKSVHFDAAHNNVVFQRTKGRKIEISELSNGFEEIKAFALSTTRHSS